MPAPLAAHYREKGWWADLPLSDILDRHADNPNTAVIDGERTYSYQALSQAADNLAGALQRRGLRRGQTALVQLGNEAAFYVTFFALLRLGVVPVNALYLPGKKPVVTRELLSPSYLLEFLEKEMER